MWPESTRTFSLVLIPSLTGVAASCWAQIKNYFTTCYVNVYHLWFLVLFVCSTVMCRSLSSALKDKCLRGEGRNSAAPSARPERRATVSQTMESFLLLAPPLLSVLSCRQPSCWLSGKNTHLWYSSLSRTNRLTHPPPPLLSRSCWTCFQLGPAETSGEPAVSFSAAVYSLGGVEGAPVPVFMESKEVPADHTGRPQSGFSGSDGPPLLSLVSSLFNLFWSKPNQI